MKYNITIKEISLYEISVDADSENAAAILACNCVKQISLIHYHGALAVRYDIHSITPREQNDTDTINEK